MPSILTKLNIPQEDLTPTIHTTTTVHGTLSTDTTIIRNLLITPLNGDPSVPLDIAYTCHQLPNVLHNVPSPQEVSSIPGLSHLAEKFPPKENWPTLMLIGRDCAQSQKHLQTVSSEDRHQLAIQTPLGWTIMGKPAPYTRPLPTSSSTSDYCLVTTTVEVHPQPQEVLLTTCNEESRPTSATQEKNDLPCNTRNVRWKPELSTIHHIEAEGKQKPTSATILQQKEHATKKRFWCTNRNKRYRDQLVDWVITTHQLDALNSHNEPHCPSPRLILHKP